MKFRAKWLDWRQLAKDLSNGLNKLTVSDNFRSDEFRFKTWNPNVITLTTMTVADTVFTEAHYCVIREFCWFQFRFTTTIGGTGSNTLYVTAPIIADDPLASGQPFGMRAWDIGARIGTVTGLVKNDGYFYCRPSDDSSVVWTSGNVAEVRAWGFYRVEG